MGLFLFLGASFLLRQMGGLSKPSLREAPAVLLISVVALLPLATWAAIELIISAFSDGASATITKLVTRTLFVLPGLTIVVLAGGSATHRILFSLDHVVAFPLLLLATAFYLLVGVELFFVADSDSVTSSALSALRNRLGVELELYDPSELKIAWVVDFPLLGWNEDEQRWDAEHHPFCFPVEEDLESLASDPGAVRAQSYDLVCNGYEAGSGSIRIHDPVVQQQVFDLLGINSEEAEMRFGFLLEALRYGAPPHGGIALGLDRWVMMFAGHDNIRDVIAFPKTQKAADLLLSLIHI